MSNPHTAQYDQFYQKSIEELAQAISRTTINDPNDKLMRLVYEQKTIERQDEYNKQQIELQHKRNTELVEKQGRWIKFSAVLTAISTLTAAIAGSLVTYMLTRPLQQQTTKTETQQQIELRTKNTTSGTLPEQKPYKVPLSPPKIGDAPV